MHELAATRDILETALSAARNAGARKVAEVEVVIGDLSSMVDDSVQFYFDVLSRGTPAEGAGVRIRRVHARAACAECGVSYEVSPPLSPVCACCGSLRLQVRGGREFFIESIQVDE